VIVGGKFAGESVFNSEKIVGRQEVCFVSSRNNQVCNVTCNRVNAPASGGVMTAYHTGREVGTVTTRKSNALEEQLIRGRALTFKEGGLGPWI
jgi:hypothetical protein